MKSKISAIHYVVISIILLLINSSCEKVIKLDLNSENPKIIIEAPIDIDSSTHRIIIKQTVNFDSEIGGVPITTADVSLSNGTNSIKFNHASNGEYIANTPLDFFSSNKSYELNVNVNGKTYSASSNCPTTLIPLDSIGVYKQKTFGRYNYSVVALRNETPKGVPNWYQYKAKKNGVKINKILFDDDQNLDGVTVTRKPIFDLPEFSPDTILNDLPKFIVKENGGITLKDSVELELTLVNIEYKVYRYFFNLVLNQGGRQSATPSNPDPLFTNGALGYFSVQKSYTKKKWINTK